MLDRVYRIHFAAILIVSFFLFTGIPSQLFKIEESGPTNNVIVVEEVELIQTIPEDEILPLVDDLLTIDIKAPLTVSETTYKEDDTNLLNPSNVSLEELEYSLRYELKPLASAFLEAEENYGVNACYLASISAWESGWGRYQFKENNLFGFGSKSFNTPEECIDYVANFLATEYLSEDGRYFSGGYSLSHVNEYYNGSDEWYEGVSNVYAGIMNRVQEYRG